MTSDPVAKPGTTVDPTGVDADDPHSVCVIAGNIHSGTTIASMLVGQHHAVFTAGALKRFPNGKQFSASNRCTCGLHPINCELWSAVLDRLKARPGDPDPSAAAVARAIRQVSARPLTLDCTHNAYRLEQLALELGQEPGISLSAILIERTALEIASIQVRTALRKRRVRNTALARLKVITRGILMRRELRKTATRLAKTVRIVRVDYHELCQRPAEELERIWGALGLDPSDAVLHFEAGNLALRKPAHMIHGNSRLRAQENIRLLAMGINTSELYMHEKWYASALSLITAALPFPSVRRMRRWLGHDN